MLIFARIGAMVMLFPALSERNIPVRIRLGFALAFCFALYPVLLKHLPVMPSAMEVLIALLFHEILIGLILGGITRLATSAAQTAGSVIAFQLGLSMAMANDPTQVGQQGNLLGNFLALTGILVIFTANLHHILLAGLVQSYVVFGVDNYIAFESFSELAIQLAGGAFAVGVQLGAPFLVFGLVFYLALGILGRMLPQIQVFFMAMPANIAVGLVLFMLLFTLIMARYRDYIELQFSMLWH